MALFNVALEDASGFIALYCIHSVCKLPKAAELLNDSTPGYILLLFPSPFHNDIFSFNPYFYKQKSLTMFKLISAIFLTTIIISCQKQLGLPTPTPNCDAPVASFSSSFTGSLPVSVEFTNLSIAQPGSVFIWDFGNGNTSTLSNPLHNYAANGTYVVKLMHTYTGGGDTVSKAIVIDINGNPGGGGGGGAAGTTNFSYNIRPAIPYKVTFTNTSVSATGFLWNFGDGSPSLATTNLLVNHTYAASGNYTVKLWATNCNMTDSTSRVLVLP